MPDFDDYEESYDEYDSDDSMTVDCPNCGAEIYEDSEQCAICGEYITHSTRVSGLWRQTALMLLIGAAILAAIYFFGAVFRG